MANTETLDEELVAGLKAAKSKPAHFALVMKGGADGALVVTKQKVPPVLIMQAKKKCGGSAVIEGMCFYEDGKLIFEMDKVPSATMPNVLKLIAKRDAGMSIVPICRMATATPPPPSGELQSPDGQSQDSGKKGKAEEKSQAGPVAGAEKFAAALNIWEQASALALSSVEKLSSALDSTGDEIALAISGILQKLMDDFPETLGDALENLNKAAKAGNSAGAAEWRNKSEIAVRACLAFLGNNSKTIDGCEDNPFGVAVKIRAPLTEALKQVLINVK